jgi:hypothetical protein
LQRCFQDPRKKEKSLLPVIPDDFLAGGRYTQEEDQRIISAVKEVTGITGEESYAHIILIVPFRGRSSPLTSYI